MKLAISGKGGVGKTLLAALLARTFSRSGYSVTAIDADPDANLALTLGCPNHGIITPISEMKDLIQERTETAPGQAGPYFKINPRVDDIPARFSVNCGGVRLLVMGKPRAGGAGCYCPENAVLAALAAHLLLSTNEVVIMDMAAGIEHLNRGTARAVDHLIVVVEPGTASIETAKRIFSLARDLGIVSVMIVGNKIRNEDEKDYISKAFPDYNILGFLPFEEGLSSAELAGKDKLEQSKGLREEAQKMVEKLRREKL
jgi:CO dehydrogenase maturation factor